jgi:hypothetical protein
MGMRRIEIILNDKLAYDFMSKMKQEGFVKNNGEPAWSQAIKHLIRRFIYD